MSLIIMVSMSMCFISFFIMLIQPLSLGFMILLVNIFMSMLIGFFSFSWYGYILFLVYVGGLMVMFMYIISLIPNLIFFSKGMLLYLLMSFSLFMVMNYYSFYNYIIKFNLKEGMMDLKLKSTGFSSILMSDYNFFSYVFLGVLLLLILISVVKICYYCDGPLRAFKYKYA
uniref:NADH dehydrogenase subunit 6 n=1 Tax=Argonauta argo TaxID=294695 RepID=A0A7R7IIK3_9MOLL|nr:NADH dehydrogenase subunit 6 [Argonauta argo]WAP91601.1 NADH dehydrogenase subunit 6 [Argonauta argo]BCN86449.1 NADH dehydrogenase subunit 6 [Argonauta argo]